MRTLLTTLVFLALLAAPARGATISLTYELTHTDRETSAYARLTLTAAPGERNDVTVTRTPDLSELRVTDHGAPLTLGANCAPVPDGAACPLSSAPAPIESVTTQVALADGDDRLAFAGGVTGEVAGGPGDDRLDVGRGGSSVLLGGDGDDVLLGSPGSDVLTGGAGADTISGGDGTDEVSYADHAAGVTVRLGTTGPGGAPGEGDTIGGDVENATGGAGDDVLIGTDGPNALAGRGGSDRMEGAGGDDVLDGDDPGYGPTIGQANAFLRPAALAPATADVLIGGAGRDFMTAGPGALLDGGAGTDLLRPAGAATVRPGPGDDLVLATGGGLTADTRDDDPDGGADRVRCLDARPARRVRLGDRDFADGCGAAAATQDHLRAIALLPSRGVPYGDLFLPSGAYLTCSDAAPRGCVVRVSVRTTSGHAILARRVRLAAGGRLLLAPKPPPAEVRRLTARTSHARVTCVFTGRAVGVRGPGAVRTIRLRADLRRTDPWVEAETDLLWR
jgi:RTX calcium-binding nonapeptide repeat (4 copies)